MNIRAMAFLAICLLPALTLSCASSGNQDADIHTAVGRIEVIGNEPFTKLALATEGGPVFVLLCEKDVEHLLLQHQGQRARIRWTSIQSVPEGKSVRVIKAELLAEGAD